MAIVDYVPFATGGSANVESQAAYLGSGPQINGMQSGISSSATFNKVWRQSSMFAACIANFISVQLGGINVLDDGNISALITNFTNAILAIIATALVSSPVIDGGTITGVTIGGATIDSSTLNSPTIATPAIVGGTVTGVTIGGSTIDSSTLNSPIVDGTPSGTGIPTTSLKQGTGAGNYTHSGDTNWVPVDATNLAATFTIPVGWKLMVFASGCCIGTAATTYFARLLDSVAGALQAQTFENATAFDINANFSLLAAITGDGASHTVTLQFQTSNSGDTVTILNTSGIIPTMIFVLTPSN